MSINSILKPYMEDIVPLDEKSNVSEEMNEQDNVGQDNIDLTNHQELVDDAIEKLEEISLAQDRLEEINNVQAQNLQVLSDHSGEFVPVEGGIQEPLPENEDEVVAIIGDQMYKEQLVVENIAGMLGCLGDKHLTGTAKLYKTLGVRTSPYTPKDIKLESFGERNKKIKAIAVYKSHCEGIGDAVKKLGGAVWNGIKKLIQSIIDFVKTMVSGFGSIEKNVKAMKQKASEIEGSINDYDLSDEMKKGLTEVNPATLIIDLETPTLAMVNASILNKAIKGVDVKTLDDRGLRVNFNALKWKTAKFENIDGACVVSSNGFICLLVGSSFSGEVESISAKFGKPADAVDFVLAMADQFTKDGKQYMNDANAVMSALEKLGKDVEKLEGEDVSSVKRDIQRLLKAAKASTSAPKYAVAAMSLALKHLVKKDEGKKAE